MSSEPRAHMGARLCAVGDGHAVSIPDTLLTASVPRSVTRMTSRRGFAAARRSPCESGRPSSLGDALVRRGLFLTGRGDDNAQHALKAVTVAGGDCALQVKLAAGVRPGALAIYGKATVSKRGHLAGAQCRAGGVGHHRSAAKRGAAQASALLEDLQIKADRSLAAGIDVHTQCGAIAVALQHTAGIALAEAGRRLQRGGPARGRRGAGV